MEVTINGEVKSFEGKSLTVKWILSAEHIKSPDMVSVQLNGEFVERSKYSETNIKNGDTLDFLYFMGGGR